MESTLKMLHLKHYMIWKVNRIAYNNARDAFLSFIRFEEKIGEKDCVEFAYRIVKTDFAKTEEVSQEFVAEAARWCEGICNDLGISGFQEEVVEARLHSENERDQLLACLLKAILACGKKKEEIEDMYIKLVLNEIIDDYVKRFSEEPSGINKCFCPLSWGEAERDQLPECYEDLNGASLKLLGTAGSGKTTQAWHYYLEALGQAQAEMDILPVWIELKQFNTYKKEDLKVWILKLIEKVTNSTEDAKNLYNLLRGNGKLVLFLDGLNEAIELSDNDKTVLRGDIASYESNEPKGCQIILTDRVENHRTHWLADAMRYQIRPMDEKDVERFIDKYESEKNKLNGVYSAKDYAEIREYMKKVLSDNSVDWEFKIIPAKLDMVFRNYNSDWMNSKATKTAFEEEYFEYLISREQDKGENENLLKGLLSATVNQNKEVYFSGKDTKLTNEEIPQLIWNMFNGIESYRYLSLFVEMGIFENKGVNYNFTNEVYFEYVKRGYREADKA